MEYSTKFNKPNTFYNTKEFEVSIMNFIIISEMAEKIS
jgi:hypothetical protein